MSHYIALVHGDDGNFGVSFPDFPGCITVSPDLQDCPRRAAEVLAFHAAGMIEDGLEIPKPRTLPSVLADPDWGDDARAALSIFVPLILPFPESSKSS